MKPLSRPRQALNIAAATICGIVIVLVCATSAEARPPGLVICETFGTKCHLAIQVAYCESRLNPRAVSRTQDVGLFQANFAAHHRRGESFSEFRRRMSDPERNVAFAWRLSRRGTDWSAWRWSAHCWN